MPRALDHREMARDFLGKLHLPRRGVIGELDAERRHARAVRRHPVEQLGGQHHLVRAGAHEHVAVRSRVPQQHRQRRGVTKRVDVVADTGADAELLREIALPVQRLPDEGFTRGDVAVRLNPPAIDDDPAALCDVVRNAREQRRIERLDPRIDVRLAAREHELAPLVEPVDRRPARADRLCTTFGPAPQPHRIEMRVADHVQHENFLLQWPVLTGIDRGERECPILWSAQAAHPRLCRHLHRRR